MSRSLRFFGAAAAAGALTVAWALPAGAAGTDAKGALRCAAPFDAAALDAMFTDGGSPLAGEGSTFVTAAASVGLDPRALVAIAAHESVLLTHAPAARIHNPFGIGPHRPFATNADAITFAATLLAKNYVGEGRTTLAAIAGKWAPLGVANDPTNLNANWTGGVGALYRRLGGNPDAPITLTSQVTSNCGDAPAQMMTPSTTAPAEDTTSPLVAAGEPSPLALMWQPHNQPAPSAPGMAGGHDPANARPATISKFAFPVIPSQSPVQIVDTFALPALDGGPGCYGVPARCTTLIDGAAHRQVVAAIDGTLMGATALEQRSGIAFWIVSPTRDRIGYSGLASYLPGIAHRTAVSAGQPIGVATNTLTVAWERDGQTMNIAPMLTATLTGAP